MAFVSSKIFKKRRSLHSCYLIRLCSQRVFYPSTMNVYWVIVKDLRNKRSLKFKVVLERLVFQLFCLFQSHEPCVFIAKWLILLLYNNYIIVYKISFILSFYLISCWDFLTLNLDCESLFFSIMNRKAELFYSIITNQES